MNYMVPLWISLLENVMPCEPSEYMCEPSEFMCFRKILENTREIPPKMF